MRANPDGIGDQVGCGIVGSVPGLDRPDDLWLSRLAVRVNKARLFAFVQRDPRERDGAYRRADPSPRRRPGRPWRVRPPRGQAGSVRRSRPWADSPARAASSGHAERGWSAPHVGHRKLRFREPGRRGACMVVKRRLEAGMARRTNWLLAAGAVLPLLM